MSNLRIMDDKQIQAARMRALASTYTKVDRVLSGQMLSVTVEEHDNSLPPAWFYNKQITLNTAAIGPVRTRDDVVAITGLNYHELGHAMFTPNYSVASHLRTSSNLLEDQRMESLLVATYPQIRPYLMLALRKHFIGKVPDSHLYYYLSACKYLGRKFIDKMRREYVNQNDIPAIDRVNKQYWAMLRNVERHRRQLDAVVQKYKDLCPDPAGVQNEQERHGDRFCNETPKPQSSMDKDIEDAEKALAEQEANGEYDNDNDADGQGEGQDDGQEGQDGKGKGKGSGTDGQGGTNDQSASEQFDKMTGAATSSDEFNRDVNDNMEKFKSGRAAGYGAPEEHRSSGKEPVDIDLHKSVKQITRELERVQADADPGWHKHRSSGRVNVGRAMQGADLDDVFDVWDEGRMDAVDIEAVVLVDISSSMNGFGGTYSPYKAASKAMWATKRALDELRCSTTVIAFNTGASTVYKANERVPRSEYVLLAPCGGTDPSPALTEAAMILDTTRRKQRVCIVYTDGQWSSEADYTRYTQDEPNPYEVLRLMSRAGVATVLGYIAENHSGDLSDTRGASRRANVTTVDDFVNVAKETVLDITRQRR